MKLRAEELMVGNWVRGIRDDNITTFKPPHFDDMDNWEGIPLTEDWLKRLGFLKDLSGQLYLEPKLDDTETNFVFYFEVDEVVLRDAYEDIYITRVHYLHQLQNLYHSLTGEELTLNN